MRVIIPYYNVDEIDFYYHLIESLHKFSKHSVSIVYVTGEAKDKTYSRFSFHKLNVLKSKKVLQPFLHGEDICKQIKGVSGDVMFIVSDLWALNLARLCFRKIGIPYVVWIRGDHRRVRKLRGANLFKRIFCNYLEIKCLNSAAFVIPNCMSLFNKLPKWGVKRGKITEPIHNGVDCGFFKPLNISRSSKFTVGFAGRICPEKRIVEFLRIAKDLKSQGIDFIIAGKKEMEITFPENVRYLGRLPFFEMPKFYNMIDLLVLPSATEGFPSAILEAYACEKPVLVSREAFPKELKIFGAVSDINEFKGEILKLKQDNLKEIGKEARKYVLQNFSWKRFADNIAFYLEKAIKLYNIGK
ncbi:MAG: glycosyltransferase family 4 protein [Candidatus Bathyarchaeia archaeon]